MADDEVRTPPDLPRSGQATPNRGKRREPTLIEGTAEEIAPELGADPQAPAPDPLEAPAEEAAVHEPSMAAGAAGLAGTDHAAETASAEGEVDHVASDGDSPWSPTTPDEGPAAPDPKPAGSRAPLVLSALAVLLILLLGAVLYTLYNPPANGAVAALAGDVNTLKQRIAALEAKSGSPVDLTPLQDRVAALEARPSDAKPLQDRIAALETASGQLKSAVEAMRGKLDPQSGAPAVAASQAGAAADLAPLQGKVADVESGLKALQGTVASIPKTDLAPLDARLAALGDKLVGAQAELAALPRIDLAPVNTKIEEIDHRLAPIEAQFSAPKIAEQVTATRQNGSAAETRSAPLAVTAQSILQAIDDDRPFAPALNALQQLGVAEATLAPLIAVADKGAPTQADLLAGFEDVKAKMVGAGTPIPTGGVLDRMLAGAEGLVKVRRAGASSGQDPDAIVSRIDSDLRRRDDQAALNEWQGLPDDGKAASRAWMEWLKSRVDAETAARSVVANAIAALGSSQ